MAEMRGSGARMTCGEHVWFTVEEKEAGEVVLTVEGEGETSDGYVVAESPFAPYADVVTDVVIGDGVSEIGGCAFRGFGKLARVSFGKGVKILGVSCFSECAGLTEVTLPEGLRVIGPKAFEKCVGIQKLWLPSTLKSIDFKAFYGDDAVTDVYFGGTLKEWRRVRISSSGRGNATVTGAEIHTAAVSSAYGRMADHMADVIAAGGDGRLYVLAPDLTVEGVKGKSGDCSVIVFPKGHVMMIDAGLPACGVHVMELVRALRLKRLDYFVLSHPHIDHSGIALKVADYLFDEMGGGVGEYWSSGYENKTIEHDLAEYMKNHGAKVVNHIRAGDTFCIDGVNIELMGPFDGDDRATGKSDAVTNNASLVMKFVYGKSTYLTSGDLYLDREAMMAEKYGEKLHADVVKANHHGCFTSNSKVWFETTRPQILLTLCDDVVCTVLEETIAEMGIPNYKVFDYGLTIISMGQDADYKVETEYSK